MTALEIAESAQSIVHSLRERLAAAERTVAEVPSRRASLAFKSSQGDKRAQTKLGELATAEAAAQRDCEDLRAALTEARRRLEDARAAEREEYAREASATAKRLAAAFLEQSEKIDKALAEIGAAHKRRNDLRRQLASTGCVETSNLDCWIRMRLAIAHAGVFGILCPGVNAPSSDDRIALATSDRRTLANMRT